jgi:hypothetical protein
MSIFSNIEAAMETGYQHIRDLLSHADVHDQIINDAEMLGRLLENPVIKGVAESLFPAAIPAYKLIDAATALDTAVRSGQGVAGAVTGAVQAALPLVPEAHQEEVSTVVHAVETIAFPGEGN